MRVCPELAPTGWIVTNANQKVGLAAEGSIRKEAIVPLLVYITGKLGAGKSEGAKKWAALRGAKLIEIDRILSVAGKHFSPDVENPYSWRFWKEIEASGQQEACLLHALAAGHQELQGYTGDLAVEGSILCQDWFYDAFNMALSKSTSPDTRDYHYLYLNPPDDVIHANIHQRGRVKEVNKFKTVEDVTREHGGFEEAIRKSKNPWNGNMHTTSAALSAALDGLSGS